MSISVGENSSWLYKLKWMSNLKKWQYVFSLPFFLLDKLQRTKTISLLFTTVLPAVSKIRKDFVDWLVYWLITGEYKKYFYPQHDLSLERKVCISFVIRIIASKVNMMHQNQCSGNQEQTLCLGSGLHNSKSKILHLA